MALNKEIRSARRAHNPLFPIDRTPQAHSDDFFTDSLIDASKIPSPSPKRQPFHKVYKDRRALRPNGALKTAWQASPRSSFSDNDGAEPSPNHLRPTKLPSPGRSPSPLRPIHRTNTPPPEISPTSPSIVSSPAHGLDETYKRIAEEEDIAAQEGQLEDEEEYTDEMYEDHNGDDNVSDALPDNGLEMTGDPANWRTDRGKENVPLEDGTAGTHVSGNSFLEGLTDQGLAAKLTPHVAQAARDRAIIEKASQRQSPIIFNPVKNGPTLSDRLQRRGTPETQEFPQQEPRQVPLNDSDDIHEPPPNVPKSWAKPRPGNNWMARSRQRREQGKLETKSSPGPDSSQVDWAAAAADIPLPSVEDSATPKVTTSRNSSPASLRSQPSLDRVRQWEFNDFTGQSLQVSDSPPMRPRAILADQNQQREIERVEKQAVTTSRLGQYQRRDPNVLIKKLSRTHLPDNYPTPEPSATPPPSGFHPALVNAATSSASSQIPRAVKFTGNGEALPNSPVVIYRSSSSSSNGTSKQDSNPSSERKASDIHFAKLARALSNSPKSESTPEHRSSTEPAEKKTDADTPIAETKEPLAHDTLIEKVVKENQEAAQRTDSSRQSSKEHAEEETTPRANKVAESAKTPKVTGAWTDTILPDTVLRTIRKQGNALPAQTPLVSAGGWIETPAPVGKRQSSALAPIPIEEEDEKTEEIPVPEGLTNGISKPRDEAMPVRDDKDPGVLAKVEVPRTALARILARAKSRLTAPEGQQLPESNDTLHLNESTINSFEGCLTLDSAELTTLIRMGAEAEVHEQLLRDSLGAEPVGEADILDRLFGKLQALRTNIHDARKGITKLEHQVAASPELLVQPRGAVAHSAAQKTCTTCGSAAPSAYLISIALPFPLTLPHLFHARRPQHFLPRPTWLGWLTLLAWLWYAVEMAMCHAYAHPLVLDHSYVWPSEPEPGFPFVLPTMLWRWCFGSSSGLGLGWGLKTIWWLVVAAWRVVGQAAGWTDGFVDDGFGVGQGLETAADGAAAAGTALGMDGDAFL